MHWIACWYMTGRAELENVISRAIALAPGGIFSADAIGFSTPVRPGYWLAQVPYRQGFKRVIDEVEAHILREALTEAQGDEARAAGILGIQRRLLYDKIREHAIVTEEA